MYQMTCTSGLAQGSNNGDVEEWLDPRFILKVALTRFARNFTLTVYMTLRAHRSIVLLQPRYRGQVEVLNRLVPELRIVRMCEFGNHQLMFKVIRMNVNLLSKCIQNKNSKKSDTVL